MKVLLALAAIFLVAVTSTPCFYTSTDGLFYDLENIGYLNNNWISANDSNGNVWSIKVCQPDFVEDLNPLCPVNSSVCVSSSNGVISNRGSSSSAIFADSPYGSSNGVEVVFGTDGVCPDDNASSVKTIVEFVCQQEVVEEDSDVYYNDYSISIDSDNCFTTITVYSSNACPNIGMEDDGDYESETIMIAPFMTFFGLVLMALVFSCMCCCCIIRRRRTQKKEIAMKQFSNVAFQPIPASQLNQPQIMRQNPNFPAYNPYVQQPQFLYYYPTQQQQVPIQLPVQQQQQPQMVELDQLNGDEKLAKELQAQFDREHQV